MSEQSKNQSGGRGRGPGGGGFGGGGHFGAPVQKAKDFKGTLKRLLRYLKPHTLNLIMVLVFAIASTSFTIAAPKIMSKAMNRLQDAYMAKMMLEKMSDAQKSAVDQVNKQMKQMQQMQMKQMQQTPNAQAPQPQQQAKVDPETAKAIQEFMKLPMLSTVKDADQKADIVQKMLDLSKKMPSQSTSGAKNVKLTQAQIDGAVKAIRETNGKYDFHYIGNIALILLGMYVISSLFSLVMGLVMSGVAQKTVRDLRREVDQKLAKLPLKYFDSHPHGDILSRVTNDLDTVANTLQQSLTQIITSVITIIGYIIMMLTISPILTLIMLITLPLYVVSTAVVAKRSQKYFASQQKELGDLSGHVEEMYTGHKIVKAFGREKDSIERFEEINKNLYAAGWKAQFISGMMFPLMNFVSNLGYVGICIVGGLWITKNLLGLGDILAFIQYSRSFTMPIAQTAQIANIIQSTVACAERVFEILDE
ncbi:MAG: ABC transporter ATP-binding protein, partial [Bacillota bacterium]|nr:ABC transporter ATP-binding protein [Bacillota bacterium]